MKFFTKHLKSCVVVRVTAANYSCANYIWVTYLSKDTKIFIFQNVVASQEFSVAAQFWRGQKSRMPVLLKKGSVEMHEVEKASHMFVVHFEKNT